MADNNLPETTSTTPNPQEVPPRAKKIPPDRKPKVGDASLWQEMYERFIAERLEVSGSKSS